MGSDIASFQSIWVLQRRQGSARGGGVAGEGRGESNGALPSRSNCAEGFFRLRGNSGAAAAAAMRVGIFSRPLSRLLSVEAYNRERGREMLVMGAIIDIEMSLLNLKCADALRPSCELKDHFCEDKKSSGKLTHQRFLLPTFSNLRVTSMRTA